jgi:NADH dehydrogenase/NADH:ubiquinone oxidoreductase subunit G
MVVAVQVIKSLEALAAKQQFSPQPLKSPIDNFYMTDAISRASAVMAKCVQVRQGQYAA